MSSAPLESNFSLEELTLRLERIAERNRPAVSLFAARCVLRAFPLIIKNNSFDYWITEKKEDNRAHYLLAVWRSILCALLYDEVTADQNANIVSEAAQVIKGTQWYRVVEAASYVNASVHISVAAAGYAVHFARLAFENPTQLLNFDNSNDTDLRLIENEVETGEKLLWIELGEYSQHPSLSREWKDAIIQLAKTDEENNTRRSALVLSICSSYEMISKGDYTESEARVFLDELNRYFSDAIQSSKTEKNEKDEPPAAISSPFRFTATHQQAAEAISEEDHLNRKKLVETLASFLAHPANYHHQTLGLLGDWGVGKSSFIHLLKESILKNHPKQCFLFGEFNAWAYENTDNLQAGIAQEIIKALSSPEPRPEDFKRKSKQPQATEKDIKTGWSNLKRALSWYVERSLLVLRFAITLNGRQIFRLLLSIFIAACPWLPVFAEFFNELLTSLTNHSDPYITMGGRILWAGGFGFYFAKEVRTLLANPLAKELLTYIRLPDYAKHLGTIPQMRKNIETLCRVRLKTDSENSKRLLFVVDDLDRCGHQAIVKVLEAVRLVLDIQNVMVVIAVDHRIALAALALHYKDFAEYHNSKDSRSIARDYLAKVIHLPITLYKPRGKDVEAYLKFIWSQMITEEHRTILEKVTPPAVGETVSTINQSSPNAGNTLKSENESNIQPITPKEKSSADKLQAPTKPDTNVAQTSGPSQTPVVTEPTIIASLSSDHQKAFLYWVDYFELSNPRQVKRLNNSYNLLHSYYDYDSTLAAHNLKETHKDAFIFPMMLALFIMEYLNTLDDDELRVRIKTELRKTAQKKEATDEPLDVKIYSTLVSADIILVINQLKDSSQTDFIKVVEPFVLPAIECY